MTSELHADLMPVLIFAFERSIERMLTEVLDLEGYPVQRVHTDEEARSVLESHEGNFIVLMDNLQVHAEGQQLLAELRQNPSLRARVKTVCMAVTVNNERMRQAFGDVLDAYLAMPFTVPQLLNTLASL